MLAGATNIRSAGKPGHCREGGGMPGPRIRSPGRHHFAGGPPMAPPPRTAPAAPAPMSPRPSIALAALAVAVPARAQTLVYPKTTKVTHVDDYFGTKVADPYRWLEDDTASAVRGWVQAENAVTFGYLNRIPFRARLRARLEELQNYPRYSAPSHTGPYYVFSKNDGLQNQSVLYIQRGLDGPAELLLDPNALSADGTVRLGANRLPPG